MEIWKDVEGYGGTIMSKEEMVNHPLYYGGEENPFEPIKIIEHYNLNFSLGCVIKYILRAGKKDVNKTLEDLRKAEFYIKREIQKYDFMEKKTEELRENYDKYKKEFDEYLKKNKRTLGEVYKEE